MSKKQTDIIISGAGAAGLTLAVLLAKAGLSVALIEPADRDFLNDDSMSGRSVALMNGSINILKAAGVWDTLEPLSNPLKTMTLMDVSREGVDPVVEPFEACDIGEEQYGFNIPNNALRAALFKAAEANENITLYLGHALTDYLTDGAFVDVTMNNEAEIKGRILIGADGRSSKVRELAGIECDIKHYEQSAVTCVINHSKAHNDTSTEFHRPHGPLALVPLRGNQSCIVWVNETTRAAEIMVMEPAAFEQALQEESHDVLGAVTLASEPQCWPLSSLRAKCLTAPRVAIMAEAAHVMSPITAQGLNLSLRDVAALAEEIVDAARVGADIGGGVVLSAYEKRRKLDVDSRVFGVDRMMRVVSNDIEAVKGLRHAGLKALGGVPPLKRFAMRVGLAPAVDAGRLSRGEVL